jgi:hypothetical protein
MKTITRSNIYLPMAAMILTAVLAAPAAARQVPFVGAMQGDDVDALLSPTTVMVTTTGTGIGTDIGQFSVTLKNTVNLATGTSTGSGHWIASNGDSIDTTIVGSGEPTDNPDVVRITEMYTITGGTGRFAGAKGTFTVERLGNGVTFKTFGWFFGTITSPGAAH